MFYDNALTGETPLSAEFLFCFKPQHMYFMDDKENNLRTTSCLCTFFIRKFGVSSGSAFGNQLYSEER